MQAITVKQTRDELADILEQVYAGGKSFAITKFGKVKALLVPVTTYAYPSAVERKALLRDAQNVWSKRTDIKDPAAWAAQLRQQASHRQP